MTDDSTYYDIDDGVEIAGVNSWALGIRFDVELPDPIEILITRIGESDDPLLIPIPFCDGNMCLATPEIAAVLQSYPGSVEAYPAVFTETKTGKKYPYYAVNILHVLPAANLQVSDWSNLDGPAILDTHFEKLVVDPQKIQGVHLFRLKEDTGTIIVSEQLKRALEHFPHLTFKKVG